MLEESDRVEFKPIMQDSIEKHHRRTQETLCNIPSPCQELKFAQLGIYYQEICRLKIDDQFMDKLGFFTADGKYNYLAYLLADKNEVSIKVTKYAGKNKVYLIDEEEYGYCSLIKATHRVLDKMKVENITKAKITSTKRIEHNIVDSAALRAAVINAIVHNDYTSGISPVFEIFSDRIVVSSFGGLIPGQSEEDFFSCGSMPRNCELMRVFKDVDLAEQLGSGMSRILHAYDRSIFDISDNFIKVVFPFAESLGENGSVNGSVNDVIETAILQILKKIPTITILQLSKELGISERKTHRLMKKLKESGRITRAGSDKKGHWIVNKD